MKNKKHWQKAFFSAFVIWTILLNSFPVQAQDIVTSEDISGGSSVFVFRQSRKVAQDKFRGGGSNVKGTPAQQAAARKRLREQANKVVLAQRQKTTKVDPKKINPDELRAENRGSKTSGKTTGKTGKTTGKNTGADNTSVKTITKEQTSTLMAGAAETYLEMNDLNNAVEFFRIALENNPNNEKAKLGLSEAYTRKGDDSFDKTSPEAAIALYKQAISYNGANAAAYAGIAEAYNANGAKDLAIQNYEKALVLNKALTTIYEPLGLLYFEKGEIAKADDNLGKALALTPDDPDLQYYVGVVRYKQNRTGEAVGALQKALAVNPSSAEAHYYLGATYDRMDQGDKAVAEYNNAVKINDNYLEAWFDLGVANYNIGRYEDAVIAYKKVLQIKNDYGQAHANLADVYRQMAMRETNRDKKRGYFELANSSYTLAAVFIKDNPELLNSWAYCLMGVNKYETAVDHLNEAAVMSPDAAYYSNIGMAYNNSANADFKYDRQAEAKSKLEKSKTALQKAISLSPRLFAAHHNLGTALLGLGDYQGAVSALQTAVGLRDDYFITSLQLGAAYRALKNFDDAVKYFKRSTELNGKFADSWYYLGESEYQRGNTKEAKKAYDKLKEIDPTYARRLDLILKGAVPVNPKNKLENKIQEKNPIKKIPIPY